MAAWGHQEAQNSTRVRDFSPPGAAASTGVRDFWPPRAAAIIRVRDFWPPGAADSTRVRDFWPPGDTRTPKTALGYETFSHQQPPGRHQRPPGAQKSRTLGSKIDENGTRVRTSLTPPRLKNTWTVCPRLDANLNPLYPSRAFSARISVGSARAARNT